MCKADVSSVYMPDSQRHLTNQPLALSTPVDRIPKASGCLDPELIIPYQLSMRAFVCLSICPYVCPQKNLHDRKEMAPWCL
jgi:hypothetical protein